jgi:acid phosphatase (class A)
MKISHIFAAMLCCLWLQPISVQQPSRGHATDPDHYFLEIDDVADSRLLLPPPPDTLSVRYQYDVERYYWGKSLRDTPRGAIAVEDARVGGDGVPRAFSEAFGFEISPTTTPETYRLVIGMREDAGDLATRSAKDYYNRQRPFKVFDQPTCNPEQQQELSTNGSYPSGHTAIGWATALVLAEVNPARQNQILSRGYQMGESRVICGYHFQSDVDAARIVASALVARLHADDAFSAQLAKAKAEIKALSAAQAAPNE